MAPRYDAQVTALGGRDGAALSSDGRLRVEMTDQPRRKGADPSGISPEHLFAAGFATSFLAAIYMAAAACRKTLAADSNVTATLSNRPRNEGGATLDLSIDLPNFSTVEAAALVERAREYCLFIEAMQDKIDIGFDIA
ncbi:hypothetical protein ADT71_12380 [Novosphingobium sp. ST904]|nr:hypothetical protein ADT71_12380 [Novosphingobium sp. ST904]TCM32431.1 Ohr subfamily peroxiredoxin [Novosphingobium sp. ST904]